MPPKFSPPFSRRGESFPASSNPVRLTRSTRVSSFAARRCAAAPPAGSASRSSKVSTTTATRRRREAFPNAQLRL
eukprot:6078893-Pleurochrysis_carterae.AAC.1